MKWGLLPVIGLAFSPTASAETLVNRGKELAYAFVGQCVQTLPNLEKIEMGVKAFGGTPVEGDNAKLLAPADPKTQWKAWIVSHAPMPSYIISIFRGQMGDHKVVGCTVINPNAPPDEVLPYIQRGLQLNEPKFDETEAGQRSRSWQISVDNHSVLINATDAQPMSQPGLTLSATMVDPAQP
jgi:hypothetical protein